MGTSATPRGGWYDPRFDCTGLWQDVTVNMEIFGYLWGKVFAEIDVTKRLADWDCPVFLALGRYDFIVAPPSTWEPVKGNFKNLTVHVFERSGHTPPLEEPELFDEQLLAWIRATAAATGAV